MPSIDTPSSMTASLRRAVDLKALWALPVLIAAGWSLQPHVASLTVVTPVLFAAAVVALIVALREPFPSPEALFLAPWYVLAFLAHLRLTSYQTAWSSDMSVAVIIGPLVACLAWRAVPAGSPGRRDWRVRTHARIQLGLQACGSRSSRPRPCRSRRKVASPGTLPLLASQVDSARAESYGVVKAWVTFLTDCSYLASWIAFWVIFRGNVRGTQRRLLLALGLVGLAASALNGSRNTFLTASLVPILFYFYGRSMRGNAVRLVAIGAGIVFLLGYGLEYRISQHPTDAFGRYFYAQPIAQTAGGQKSKPCI